jgi:hypothetical protein
VSGEAAAAAAAAMAAAQVVGGMGRSVGFKWMDGGDGVVRRKHRAYRITGVIAWTGCWWTGWDSGDD